MNNKKWSLLKASDSGPMGRGQSGKKKIYEVTVNENTVHCSWGMAEMPRRSESTKTYRSSNEALQAAYTKVSEKRDGGYAIAYAV